MSAKVYIFHITHEGPEDKIWRDIEVSSNYRLVGLHGIGDI